MSKQTQNAESKLVNIINILCWGHDPSYFAQGKPKTRYAPWTFLGRSDGVEQAEKLILQPERQPERIEAEKGPFYDFTKTQLYGLTETQREQIRYGLFYNKKTDQYLVTASDDRANNKAGPAIVDHILIDGKGRDKMDVLAEAEHIWAEHFQYLTAFYPVIERAQVDALYEAQRVRERQAEPVLPESKLFAYYPAFRAAYTQDKTGFTQALEDVFGPNGNIRLLADKNVYQRAMGGWRGNDIDDGRLGPKYSVNARTFARLYEQMPDEHRALFKQAFGEFVTVRLLDAAKTASSAYIARVAEPLAQLKLQLDGGTGITKAFNATALACYPEHIIQAVMGKPCLFDMPPPEAAAAFNAGKLYDLKPEWPGNEAQKAPQYWFQSKGPDQL